MRVCTNAVVAIWVELTLVLGVGAVGTPVKAIFEARVVVMVPEPDPVIAPVKVIDEPTPAPLNKLFTKAVVAI
jgi:hypothetical protein